MVQESYLKNDFSEQMKILDDVASGANPRSRRQAMNKAGYDWPKVGQYVSIPYEYDDATFREFNSVSLSSHSLCES